MVSNDSDADTLVTGNADLGQTPPTEFLLSADSNLTLDAGVVCVLEVDAGANVNVCQTGIVTLNGFVNPPGAVTAQWTSSGDGSFDNGTGEFSTATSYTPGPNDIASGQVSLTLTADGGICGMVEDTVEVRILNVDCGTYPWSGN